MVFCLQRFLIQNKKNHFTYETISWHNFSVFSADLALVSMYNASFSCKDIETTVTAKNKLEAYGNLKGRKIESFTAIFTSARSDSF